MADAESDQRATVLKEYRTKLLQHKEVEARVRSSERRALHPRLELRARWSRGR
jgi:hypothetical protein